MKVQAIILIIHEITCCIQYVFLFNFFNSVFFPLVVFAMLAKSFGLDGTMAKDSTENPKSLKQLLSLVFVDVRTICYHDLNLVCMHTTRKLSGIYVQGAIIFQGNFQKHHSNQTLKPNGCYLARKHFCLLDKLIDLKLYYDSKQGSEFCN